MRKAESSAAALFIGLLVVIGAPICFCAWLFTEHRLIAIAIVGIFAAAIARSQWAKSKRHQELVAYYTAMIANAKAIVSAHAAELTVRRKQLTTTLSYGVMDDSKWCNEIEFFIDNVIVPAGCDIRSSAPCLEVIRDAINAATIQFHKSRLGFSPAMDPADYESMVADALTDLGWHTRLTKASGDQGIDVIAEKRNRRVVIQCKRYASSIGNSAVQEAHAGKAFEGADFAAVVSNATFTRSARQLAASTNVILLHHDELAQLEARMVSPDETLPTAGRTACAI